MNKKVQKHVKKATKKSNKSILLCFIIFLLIGGGIGYFTVNQLTKNDTFALIGEKNITINLNENYIEQGVTAISFGKDLKDKVIIQSNVDTTTEGEYTVIYTINSSFKYKNIKRVRYVTVTNGSDANE